MTLEDFYKTIKNNNIPDDLIIFQSSDEHFVEIQYVEEIAKQHHLKIVPVFDVELINTSSNIFDNSLDQILQVCIIDELDITDVNLQSTKNLIIICEKISSEALNLFKKYIIKVPKLEGWQVKDYIFSQLEGVSTEHLDWISHLCDNNAHRASNEINRLIIFPQNERDGMFIKFKNDGIYDDLTSQTVFDFIKAIVTRNIAMIADCYIELKNIEHSPFGILALLYNNFKNIIKIQCSPSATAASCGISDKQFWAIQKYNINHYTIPQLIHIFKSITDMDRKIKSGEIDINMMIDYLLLDILNC